MVVLLSVPTGTTVYTKIDGKLAAFIVDTADTQEAISTVKGQMKVRHRGAVLALINSKKTARG